MLEIRLRNTQFYLQKSSIEFLQDIRKILCSFYDQSNVLTFRPSSSRDGLNQSMILNLKTSGDSIKLRSNDPFNTLTRHITERTFLINERIDIVEVVYFTDRSYHIWCMMFYCIPLSLKYIGVDDLIMSSSHIHLMQFIVHAIGHNDVTIIPIGILIQCKHQDR